MQRLCEVGHEAVEGIEEIELSFAKVQKFYKGNKKCIQLYMHYSKEVLNDKETHDIWYKQLLECRNPLEMNENLYNSSLFGSANSLGEEEENGCVLVSGKINNLGEILNVNAGMCKLFGYTKIELVGQPTDVLMPQLYRKHHHTFMENIIKPDANFRNSASDIFVLGLTKCGYLIPVTKHVKQMSSLSEGLNLLGIFKLDKKSSSSKVAMVLLDSNKNIEGISTSKDYMINHFFSLHQNR